MKILISLIILVFLPLIALTQENIDFTLGVKYETSNIKSIWATVGKDTYFIYEVGHNLPKDESTKHPYYDENLRNNFNHQRLDDIIRRLYWSVGVGHTYKFVSLNLNVCMTKEDTYFQFLDETLFFSPNGRYSFLGETGGFVSGKIGTIITHKKTAFAFDYNLTTKRMSFGLGRDF